MLYCIVASATALVNYAEADADEESDEEREDPEAVVVGATGEAVDDFMAEVDAIFKEKESKADDWKEVRDAKGQIYFVHSRTGETAWTRPVCLRSLCHSLPLPLWTLSGNSHTSSR